MRALLLLSVLLLCVVLFSTLGAVAYTKEVSSVGQGAGQETAHVAENIEEATDEIAAEEDHTEEWIATGVYAMTFLGVVPAFAYSMRDDVRVLRWYREKRDQRQAGMER